MHLQKSNVDTGEAQVKRCLNGRLSAQRLSPVPKNKESWKASDQSIEFVTIDAFILLAQELLTDLTKLGGYKYPFDVRKGVSIITPEKRQKDSLTVKAGSRTYFFDVQETKEEKPFMTITESRFRTKEKDYERNTITVFPEQINEFSEALTKMLQKVKQ